MRSKKPGNSDKENWKESIKVFPVYDDVEGLERVYLSRGSSYAVVRNGSDFGRPGFVPLTPRHMTARHWRCLYWLGVKKLVVYGRENGSLCDSCFNNILCLQAGRGKSAHFRCKVTSELLTIETGRRHRGRDRDGPAGSRSQPAD
jgi:hypothetical protein